MLRVFLLVVVALSTALAKEPPLPADLGQYLKLPDKNAGWETKTQGNLANCDYWHLALRSQTWQGLPWTHDLVVFRPANGLATDKMLLINEGGSFRPDKLIYGATLANLMKAPVALLLGVPNQPLLDGKTEDHLIAETFVRYLDSGDNRWPLLFPMVKSVVKGMDALQEFTAKEWGGKTNGFILSGASKRGWTAWLAAASDPRVTAIAPMVIDLLNIPAQLPLQLDRFGQPSQSISPYTDRGLVPLQDSEEARALWRMVDPWTYRMKLTMPKLVVLANNDPYWSTDALNVYWNGLPGEKHISYTPNAGHDLSQRGPDGKRVLPWRALNNIAAFVRSQISGRPLPVISWKHLDAPGGDLLVEVKADPMPQEATLWIATSDDKDFRESRWESRPVEITPGGEILAAVRPPEKGFTAFYVDLGYQFDELPLRLCTQIRLAGPGVPPADR